MEKLNCCINNKLHSIEVYKELWSGGSSYFSGYESGGIIVKDSSSSYNLLSSELFYFRDLKLIHGEEKADDNFIKYGLSFIEWECFKASMEAYLNKSYTFLHDNNVYQAYTDKVKDLIDYQKKLNRFYCVEKDNIEIADFLRRIGKLDYSAYKGIPIEFLIEIYLNKQYELPYGCKFKIQIANEFVNGFKNKYKKSEDLSCLSIEGVFFKGLHIKVESPISVLRDNVLYKVNIELEKIHASMIGFDIDFNDINLKVKKHIDEIFIKCKEFDANNEISRIYGENQYKKIKNLCLEIDKFICENSIPFTSYRLDCSYTINKNNKIKYINKEDINLYEDDIKYLTINIYVRLDVLSLYPRGYNYYSTDCYRQEIGDIDYNGESFYNDVYREELFSYLNHIKEILHRDDKYRYRGHGIDKRLYDILSAKLFIDVSDINYNNIESAKKIREQVIKDIAFDYQYLENKKKNLCLQIEEYYSFKRDLLEKKNAIQFKLHYNFGYKILNILRRGYYNKQIRSLDFSLNKIALDLDKKKRLLDKYDVRLSEKTTFDVDLAYKNYFFSNRKYKTEPLENYRKYQP